MPKPLASILILLLTTVRTFGSVEDPTVVIHAFHAPAAKQGVAVDEHAIYVVSNHALEKYDKTTYEKQAQWSCEEGAPLIHLNAGFVYDGKLYCPHSNYPESPMESSIEIFDCDTLQPIGSISFGVLVGSATWVVRHQNQWWMGFAHYTGRGSEPGKDNSWTQVVVFDDQWRRVRGYTMPKSVIERFGTRSNSGGDWGPDGRLYLTGHDHNELYAMKLPTGGSKLVLDEVIPVAFKGQAFAWDRFQKGFIWGIIKGEQRVVVQDLSHVVVTGQ